MIGREVLRSMPCKPVDVRALVRMGRARGAFGYSIHPLGPVLDDRSLLSGFRVLLDADGLRST
jgi:hypothetical protein